MHVFAYFENRLKVTNWDPSRRFVLRLVLTIVAVTVIYIMAQVNSVRTTCSNSYYNTTC